MPDAPTAEYPAPDGGGVLTLRGALTPKTRRQYAEVRTGGLDREDAWQRGVEFLFERLAVRWDIAGVPVEGQRDLLLRLRAATPAERAWVRDALRVHCAEFFPELQAP